MAKYFDNIGLSNMSNEELALAINELNEEKKRRENEKKYQIARHGWSGDYVDPMTFLEMWTSTSTLNEAGFSNNEYDALIKDAIKEQDTKKREEILHKAEDILMDEMPVIPIYYYTQIKGVKSYVKDMRVSQLGFIYFDEAYIEGK